MPFEIIRDDITNLATDIIVNSSNSKLQASQGVCGSIFEKAGRQRLQKACDKLAPIETSQAVITRGYNLSCKYIIHTLAPIWNGGNDNEAEMLFKTYINCLKLAKRKRAKSIAFPLLSSGRFGYPKNKALEVATAAIEEFLLDNDMHIYIVVFDKKSFLISEGLFNSVKQYIDDKYVEHNPFSRGYSNICDFEIDELDEALDVPEINEPQNTCDSLKMIKPDEALDLPKIEINDNKCKLDIDKYLDLSPNSPKPKPKMMNDDIVKRNINYNKDKLLRVNSRSKKASRIDKKENYIKKNTLFKKTELFSMSLDDALKNMDETFSETLLKHIDNSGKTDAQIYKKANIDRRLFSKIRKNKDYTPSKNTILSLAIALELPLDETKKLLEKAGYALSHSNKFDIIIEYFIINEIYNIFEINEALFSFDQNTLKV